MKQSIQLKLGQSLTMTPQLQQAIKLLQLSTVELQNEIQEALDSNPMLESPEELGPSDKQESKDTEGLSLGSKADASETGLSEPDFSEPAPQATDNQASDEIQIEVNDWEQSWENNYKSGSSDKSNYDFGEKDFLENQETSANSLHEHLIWQLELTHMSDTDKAIATTIIDSIDEDGYLHEDINNIHSMLTGDLEIELDEVEAVLNRVQHFDPIGVAARTLSECLKLQLNTYPKDTEGLNLAITIIEGHLDLLAVHDYKKIKRLTHSNDDDLHTAEHLIQSLTPKPGALVNSSRTEYIIPDVFITKKNKLWHAELNPDLAPRIRINSMYANMVRRADKSDDNNYLRNNLQEARWFLKSLQSRNDTILKVANNIIEKQSAFLEYGDEAMKPLVLRDVAEALEMHESTISRVTNQKYMHTPRGIYEFKHFFSSHVGTTDGGECSATAIRAMIKKLVAEEDTKKPLSDSKIAQTLDNKGINVARRTIAKYRESMSIPPSKERKRFA